MIAKILEVRYDKPNNPAYVSAHVQVKDDEGNIVFDDWRGYVSKNTDPAAVREEIIVIMENVKNQIEEEMNSVLYDVAVSMINEEIVI